MKEIKSVAVIGSGVMGAAIAAHIANSGVKVLLLDVVPTGEADRRILAKNAIKRLLKTEPSPLMHKRNAKLITPGNLEDDLAQLAEADWIIEAIIERLEIKQALYRKIDGVRKVGSIVSSNTSTLPLAQLVSGMPSQFSEDFLISHFFNPPRYMRLLELIKGPKTCSEAVETITQFADIRLGKGVVPCKDTPGFIANRIGCFWMMQGVLEAIRLGITVEQADSVMSRPVGIPKTGIFGLLDLIGIDLMPLMARSMLHNLPEHDAFRAIYKESELITNMIAAGYIGRKGKGGFYRIHKEEGKKEKQALDFSNGLYRPVQEPALESVEAAKSGLRALLEHPDIGGQYAFSVLASTLNYTASLIPEIADDITAVDEAMKLGYNWKYGPFELIDKLGATWLAESLKTAGQQVAPLLEQLGEGKFYQGRSYFTPEGYREIPLDPEKWTLADIKQQSSPIAKNSAASLWDVGDGIVCLELTTKMNSIDPSALDMINQAIAIVKNDYKGLIIGTDADNFSVGANLKFLLFAANTAAWPMIHDIIKQGQDTYMALKYAPFPVVSAVNGMAFGGGCEMLLHSDAVQAHAETYAGLVEIGVGLIPGWGGCKELLHRHLQQQRESNKITARLGRMFAAIPFLKTASTMPSILKTFELIGMTKVSKSAVEARDMLLLNTKSRISMNRRRVLSDAKSLTLSLAENYQPPEPALFQLPGKTAKAAMEMALKALSKSGKATPHDVVIVKKLADVLSGGDTDILKVLTEQQLLDIERAAFMELVKHPDSLARIEHMLEVGKPLRN